MKEIVLKMLAAVCIILSNVGTITVNAASATTPSEVTIEEAYNRIYKVKNALETTYFTTTGKTCHSPWQSSHGCSDDNVTNVVRQNASIKQKLGMVPDFNVVTLKHYNSNGTLNGKNGYSCYGFASFVAWYVLNIPVWRSHPFRPMVPPRFRWREPSNPEMGPSRRRTDQITINEMISSVNDYLSFFNFE